MNQYPYEYADGAAVVADLPHHDGHVIPADEYNSFIRASWGKLLPTYIEEKSAVFKSGLVSRVRDNIVIMENNCHDEAGEPEPYVCAPANNCENDDAPIQKGVVKKDKTWKKSLSFDPFCDQDTIVKMNRAGGAVTYAMFQMEQIAHSIARYEAKVALEYLFSQTGVTLSSSIGTWDEDTAVNELTCVLTDFFDTTDLEPSDIVIYTNNKATTPISTTGMLTDVRSHNSAMTDGYFAHGTGFAGMFDGVAWYTDPKVPANQMFIGMRGSAVMWNDPSITYSQREMGCNHGESHLWSDHFGTYVPCEKANKFTIVKYPDPC